jgi:hypothetical protein
MVQKMADVLQNQFGLKPKMQGQVYTPPFPEWYHRVALPPRVNLLQISQSSLGKMIQVVTPDFPKKTKCKPICMPGSIFMHIVDISE